ncbi:hypothetical protein EWM64_g534 [Hericium alpestre]|uniref:J domain-containing protein n=1 Tax=Hericium alpestre TaxID=135208 RepID=A0A4Z0ACN0_9AGAM|nr:hypothetical protein EWM64_g534 [Hericium alpestre]
MTFYSWLNVSPSATTPEIARAYRKKSMQLHPDKNPNVKGIHERFARLGVIATILRNTEARKRYDFFYKNGVPRWRGTGYYYSRFRPGLGSVFTFLILLSSGLHYVVQRMNYRRDLTRIEHIIRVARLTAWGQKMVPADTRRKVKVNLGGPPRLNEDGNVILGKAIDMIVESNGDVFMLEPGGGLTLINTATATPPALKRTWFAALVTSWVRRFTGGAASSDAASDANANGDDGTEDGTGTESDLPELEYPNAEGNGTNGNGNAARGGKAAATKLAGGRRRKAVRKR